MTIPGRPIVVFASTSGVNVRPYSGDGPPVISQGYGGWSERPRPRRRPITVWDGQPLWRMAVPILFDGHLEDGPGRGGLSVEAEVRALERMARPRGIANNLAPSRILCSVPAESPRLKDIEWVIESIDWGEAMRRSDGRRVRQAGTVNLLEYSPIVVTRIAPSRRRAPARPKKKGKGK
jgi:hypothetical protein